jgi:hypothetical protein
MSPISLNYVAALRGVMPRKPGDAFTYAVIDCQDAMTLIGLAASNPEGQFFGFVRDAVACVSAWEHARLRQVSNIRFASTSPKDILARFGQDEVFLPKLDYLVCDESQQPMTATDRQAVYDLAAAALNPDGLFSISYSLGNDQTNALRFLVQEFAPEMNLEQAIEFLDELKKLGSGYFATHKDHALALEGAIQSKMPDEFFMLFEDGESRSASFDTIVAMRPRGFAYAGDAHIPSNYVELAITPEAQDIVVSCRDNPLYESIKDFTLGRTIRHDIWSRVNATTSSNPVDLFGGLFYGITQSRSDVPSSYQAKGKTIALSSPLYSALINLMTLLPVSIGDILIYPACKEYSASGVLEAVQVLVACGIARPMRGMSAADPDSMNSITQPRLVGGYNQYLGKIIVTGETMTMASPILGDTITITTRDALVMQALDRVGLANSVTALMTELKRLSSQPDLALQVMSATEPTPEIAQKMVEDTVTNSIVKWYAYGLLEAA